MWLLGRSDGASLKLDLPNGIYFVPRTYDPARLAVLARLLADTTPKIRDAAVLTWKQADTLEALARIRADARRADALWALHGDAGEPLPLGGGELRSRVGSRFPTLRPHWVLILDPEAPASTSGWFEAHVKMPLVSWLGRLLNDERHPLHAAAVDRIQMQDVGMVTSDPLELIEIVEAAIEHRLAYAVSAVVPEEESETPERVNVEAIDWARSVRWAVAHRLAARVNGIPEAVRADAARLLFDLAVSAERVEGALDGLVRAGVLVSLSTDPDRRRALARSVLEDEDGRILFRDALLLSAEERRAIDDAFPRGPAVGREGMESVTRPNEKTGKVPITRELFEVLRQEAQARGASPSALASFGEAVQETKIDPALSKSLFKRAIAAAPRDGRVLGRYASSLRAQRDLDGAQKFYEQAILADPNNANNLGDYATFLCDERRDIPRAQEAFEKAIAADPKHANNLGNYARFLWVERRDLDRAQTLYEQALVADPKHANNLGNYANILWERRDLDRAQALYEQALVADPNHANNLGNYANFLLERRDLDRAQALYERALAADPKHTIHIGNLALFMLEERRDLDRAQQLFERAIAVDPSDAHNLSNFAHVLVLTGRLPAAVERLRQAMQQAAASPKPQADLACELAYYRAVHLPDERDDALRTLHTLLAEGVRSPGWDFRAHATLADKAGDPDAPLLFALADVLSAGADPVTLDAFPRWTRTAPS